MSAIWMDPVQMKASGAALAEQALRVQETMTGTRTSCVCEVPRSLIGWLDDELEAITIGALQVALTYVTEAAELVRRADELLTGQSLASLVTAPAGAPTVPGGPVLTEYGWASTAPLPTSPPGAQDTPLGAFLATPEVIANDAATGVFGDDIMAILKMGPPGGAGGGGIGGGGRWDALADLGNRDSALGLAGIDPSGLSKSTMAPNTLTGMLQPLSTGNTTPGVAPYVPASQLPSSSPR